MVSILHGVVNTWVQALHNLIASFIYYLKLHDFYLFWGGEGGGGGPFFVQTVSILVTTL